MDTANAPINATAVQTIDESDAVWIGIDVALVDGLMAFFAWRRFITRRDVVRATAALARAPYYAAEGFVTDLVDWSANGLDGTIPVELLTNALLDLRRDLTSGDPTSHPIV